MPDHLRGVPRDRPIMMYCTGGIRCDVYSTHLRRQGFTNLFTLEGGIQDYLEQESGELWNGSLYVFDGRMAVPGRASGAAAAPLKAAVPCALCGGEAELPHMNCANVDCNKLFIACPTCKVSGSRRLGWGEVWGV